MNLLYQPENPQAILARCKIKPWNAWKSLPTSPNKSSMFDLFMEGKRGYSQHELSIYTTIIYLPDVPFNIHDACRELGLKSQDAARRRIDALREKRLIYADESTRPMTFIKTAVCRQFLEKMNDLMDGGA